MEKQGREPNKTDTIAAISTPLGEGGIGIVRLSGREAVPILCEIFAPNTPSKTNQLETHRIYLGKALDPASKRLIDQAIAAVMRAPNSYTGEDVVELSCHGGPAVLKRVLEAALVSGARLAERGEFTKRAFLNGKLDLSQAEAVIDLIKAKTPEAAGAAAQQLSGALSTRIKAARAAILSKLAEIEGAIDFPDDIAHSSPQQLAKDLFATIEAIRDLLRTADAGRILRDGIKAAIIGKPNVGKSSLLNALLREERAIVSHEPGTTRDTIEEPLNIHGIPLTIIDTAGIRPNAAGVEGLGITRTRRALATAGLVIVAIDGSEALTSEDKSALKEARGGAAVVVLNKADKGIRVKQEEIAESLPAAPIFEASALTGAGIAELEQGISDLVLSGAPIEADTIVVNERHKHCLIRAKEAIERAINGAEGGFEEALVAIDLKEAAGALGAVSGEAVSDEVLEKIFSEFCVGK